MDYKHYYIIQTSNGIDKVNFNRLFESCYFGRDVVKLLGKISHYINYYDDVTDEVSLDLSSIISKNLLCVRIDKYKLIKNNKVDKIVFEDSVSSILECYEKDKDVVWFEYSGYHYFVFGFSERDLIIRIKNEINLIDTKFFSRSGETIPSLISRTNFKVRKLLNVC